MVNESADYKYLTQVILDAKPKYNVYYNSSHNVVNIGGVGYDKGELVKQFNQNSGSSSNIKNNFFHANKDPQKTKREVEKLSNGKIKVTFGKGYGNEPIVYYSLKESVNEEKVYIDFLNKKKGFKQDRIKFNSYEDAVKWAKKNFEKFNPDMIKYESVNEAKDMTFVDYLKVLDDKFLDGMKAVRGDNGSDAQIEPTRGDILQNFTLFRNYLSALTKKYKGDKTKLRFLTERANRLNEIIKSVNESSLSDIDILAQESKDFKEFVKKFFSEYKDFAKTKESLKWLEDIYKGRTKMEGLERVADALPQTEEEPVNEEEKSSEEILRGLREMALGDLERIADYANMISDRMNEGQELSSWMYSQITLAVDQLNSVHDSMDGKDGIKEAHDCGCGCKGTTVGGCNTSLTEVQLNEWRAEEVLQQLGGRKFIAMTGAKNFVKNDKDKSIVFRVPKAKNSINTIRITLTSMDVYNVDFISVRGTNIKTVATAKGVYNDQLQSIFTKYTGLYTSL